jgi:hypothetical protein
VPADQRSLTSKPPTPAQLAARRTLEAALRQHAALDPIELCAVVAYTLGQLVALQDQTRFTAEQVMAVVSSNIEAGNADVIADLLGRTRGEA